MGGGEGERIGGEGTRRREEEGDDEIAVQFIAVIMRYRYTCYIYVACTY